MRLTCLPKQTPPWKNSFIAPHISICTIKFSLFFYNRSLRLHSHSPSMCTPHAGYVINKWCQKFMASRIPSASYTFCYLNFFFVSEFLKHNFVIFATQMRSGDRGWLVISIVPPSLPPSSETILYTTSTNFPKIYKPHPNFGRQKGDMKHVPCWGPWILEWSVNLAVTWCFLLGMRQLKHIFLRKEKNAILTLKL